VPVESVSGVDERPADGLATAVVWATTSDPEDCTNGSAELLAGEENDSLAGSENGSSVWAELRADSLGLNRSPAGGAAGVG
jgi:hypothetical protein